MPFNGLLPFLLVEVGAESTYKAMCQCPLTGFFHFYKTRMNPDKHRNKFLSEGKGIN